MGIDPELNDPENGDYSLAPGSPAVGYGCRIFRGRGGGGPSPSPGAARPSSRLPCHGEGRDEIEVSGPITQDTTWDADRVKVIGDVTVTDGVTLSIAPGVKVEFQDYYRLSVLGALLAIGTPGERILFTTDEPSAFQIDSSHTGCWNGIRFHDTLETNGESRIEQCIIEYSKATSSGMSSYYPAGGGAVSVCNFSKLVIENCIFRNNAADYGGALFLYKNACPRITGNLFVNNHALENAAAIYAGYSYPVLTNNTVVNNTIHNSGNPYIESCAVLSYLSKSLFTNNIIRENDPEFVYQHSQLWQGKSFYTRFNNIEDYPAENGNIDADPLFADRTEGDLHLTWNSPCKDAGDSAMAAGDSDFEGDPRIHDGAVDMGADEFHLHLYAIGAVIPGTSIDVKVAGIPGTTPLTLALGSGIQDPPQATTFGDLFLQLPLLVRIPMMDINSDGLSVLPLAVPGSSPPGDRFPFQVLAGMELTNLMTLTVE